MSPLRATCPELIEMFSPRQPFCRVNKGCDAHIVWWMLKSNHEWGRRLLVEELLKRRKIRGSTGPQGNDIDSDFVRPVIVSGQRGPMLTDVLRDRQAAV